MIYNLIVITIIILITATAKNKHLLGVLVAAYYGVYILIALDYFGFIVGDLFTTFDEFIVWYLVYTAISFLFFLLSISLYTYTRSKTALFYSMWILFNIAISGISAVFQSFETNSFLIVYNVIQNMNLIVDIIVVILGTDNVIRNTSRVTRFINYISSFIVSDIRNNDTNSNRVIPCRSKN